MLYHHREVWINSRLEFSTYPTKISYEHEDIFLHYSLNDEIKHVGLGYSWLKRWRDDQETWDYYKSLLPDKLTPARAKGIIFNEDARRKAGIDEDFIMKLKDFRSDFVVTDRKSWKKDII